MASVIVRRAPSPGVVERRRELSDKPGTRRAPVLRSRIEIELRQWLKKAAFQGEGDENGSRSSTGGSLAPPVRMAGLHDAWFHLSQRQHGVHRLRRGIHLVVRGARERTICRADPRGWKHSFPLMERGRIRRTLTLHRTSTPPVSFVPLAAKDPA